MATEEVITVSRDELQVVDDGNNDDNVKPSIRVRRVFIAPVGFPQPIPMMASLLSHIAVAAQSANPNPQPKRVIIEEPIDDATTNPNTQSKRVSTNTQSMTGGKKQKPSSSNASSSSNSNAARDSTHGSKSKKRRSTMAIDAEDIVQSVLSRCYTIITALVALILLVSFTVYRLYQEVVVYRNIKSSFIA